MIPRGFFSMLGLFALLLFPRFLPPAAAALPSEPLWSTRASARPWGAGVDGGTVISIHGWYRWQLCFSGAREFWRHLEVEATFRLEFGEHFTVNNQENLVGFSALLRPGLRLLNRPWSPIVSGRIGVSTFAIPTEDKGTLWASALLLSPGLEFRYSFSNGLELRAAPLRATFYWNHIWELTLDPSLGLGYRF